MGLEVPGHSEAPPAQPHEASHVFPQPHCPRGCSSDQFPQSGRSVCSHPEVKKENCAN